jgi:hypothetical protein
LARNNDPNENNGAGQRYERFEMVLGRKGKGIKGWQWINRETGRIEKIEIEEREGKKRKGKKGNNLQSNRDTVGKRLEALHRDTPRGATRVGAGHYVIENNERAMALRVRMIFRGVVTMEYLDEVMGVVGVGVDREDEGAYVLANRGHGCVVVYNHRDKNKLLEASNSVINFIDYKFVDRRVDYSSIKVTGNLSKLAKRDLIAMIEGRTEQTVIGGWWENMARGEAWVDFQLTKKELDDVVERDPVIVMGSVSITLHEPVASNIDNGKMVFFRGLGVTIPKQLLKVIHLLR